VYGPRNLSGAIPTFYRQVKAGLPCTVVEDASRDFVFVEDLVRKVQDSIELEAEGSFDIRTGIETRISAIPQMIGELLEMEAVMKLIPRPPHDVQFYDMDGPAMLSIPFTHGLKKAVEWYEQHGVGETYTHLTLEAKDVVD
jgi:UDP-glucose 4-epimerase